MHNGQQFGYHNHRARLCPHIRLTCGGNIYGRQSCPRNIMDAESRPTKVHARGQNSALSSPTRRKNCQKWQFLKVSASLCYTLVLLLWQFGRATVDIENYAGSENINKGWIRNCFVLNWKSKGYWERGQRQYIASRDNLDGGRKGRGIRDSWRNKSSDGVVFFKILYHTIYRHPGKRTRKAFHKSVTTSLFLNLFHIPGATRMWRVR